jgi:hypothetical protein
MRWRRVARVDARLAPGTTIDASRARGRALRTAHRLARCASSRALRNVSRTAHRLARCATSPRKQSL